MMVSSSTSFTTRFSVSNYLVFVLSPEPENHDTGEILGKVGADIREIKVECYYDSLFLLANVCYLPVCRSSKLFIKHGSGIMTFGNKQVSCFYRQVLIDLESHGC